MANEFADLTNVPSRTSRGFKLPSRKFLVGLVVFSLCVTVLAVTWVFYSNNINPLNMVMILINGEDSLQKTPIGTAKVFVKEVLPPDTKINFEGVKVLKAYPNGSSRLIAYRGVVEKIEPNKITLKNDEAVIEVDIPSTISPVLYTYNKESSISAGPDNIFYENIAVGDPVSINLSDNGKVLSVVVSRTVSGANE